MTTLYPCHRVTPATIHAAAAMNHLATTPPATARILELGCGTASRLVMNASVWPQSVAVGIDLDEQNIHQGQTLAAALGCSNVELFAAGLGDLLAVDPGEFDYIIIHGAFTFLGQTEREALLGWCQAHLSARGVIAVRWSALPGASARGALAEALQFHLERAEEGTDLLAAARGMLSFMLVTLDEGALKAEALAAEKMDDLTLTLAYLSPGTEACTLSVFSARAEAVSLQYLGDVLPQYELGHHYSDTTEQMLNAVSGGTGRVMSQQYLDYAVQRRERFTLLCHREATAPPAAPDLTRLKALHWAGNFRHLQDDHAKTSNAFEDSNGRIINTDNGILIRIMEVLGSAWPMSLSFEQLVFNCQAPENQEDIQEVVWDALAALFMTNAEGFHWSASPGIYNTAQNDRLLPAVLLPTQRPEQDTALINLWSETVLLTPDEWDYLQSDMTGSDTSAWATFSSLKRKGLIGGAPVAWKKHLQRFLRAGRIDVLKSQLSLLLLLSVNQQQGGLLYDEIPESAVPDADVDAIYARVNALINAGSSQEAREYTRGLMEQDPENIHVLRCYSRACVLTSAWDEALASLCRLMGYYFSSLEIYYDLATTLQKKREFYCARNIVRTLVRLDSKNIDYWLSLASLHHAYGDMALGEKCCRVMLRFGCPGATYYGMTGIILSDNHKMDEARYFMEKAVEMSHYNSGYFSNLLFVMTHDANVTPEDLLAKHLEFGHRLDEWAERTEISLSLNNVKDPQRKLRLGFVSGDLRNHPVANFVLPFWDGLDRDKFELVAYSTVVSNDDAVSRHFQETSLLWRDVDSISDIELAKTIAEDGIDILFDLSGHTAHNRLPAFALRPAPVQITWIGYPGTTGLAQMDYIILPATLVNSPRLEEQLSEKAMYIASRKCFEPHPLAPEVNVLPALRNGYITFGSFNRSKKINDQVLGVWARLLLDYPESKLLIGFMTDNDMIAAMAKRMLRLGITQDRLIFRGLVEMEEYLTYHHEIDILLDSFPYTGGTTTHHGAWMGVPTLTLCGPTIACQQGVDIMTSYGLEQFIVYSEQEYIDKAVYWRDHIPELAAIRAGMRAQIPIKNEPGFNVAANFEKALREAWQLYCRGEQPRTLMITDQGTC
ncbi:methyltransferase family protein [Enterobacter sp. BIGb0383]|uniref:bifunctional class I SAM-dependent methyltransferase/glycosyltransferase n=1 Tax=unclassified Enterobacter TaxID=2608935 RepID=UPI000FB29DF7|nr:MULTISPECIES: bifunctional class I SAM-dependent methyltransferase/glycosyltransferase [unclassified Enterobacter]ROP62546.1 methyltransferase family protein [Enterobacter sp. BIGb0383]ROS12707.1 methyltransferase family protein [Enterobacter sp. BIGb0359]